MIINNTFAPISQQLWLILTTKNDIGIDNLL